MHSFYSASRLCARCETRQVKQQLVPAFVIWMWSKQNRQTDVCSQLREEGQQGGEEFITRLIQ